MGEARGTPPGAADPTAIPPRPRPGDLRAAAHGASGYPRGLDDLRDPPARVWLRGAVPDLDASVAVVGARGATPYGIARAHALAGDLARLGIAVVSGLARGIDAAAHRGALEAGGVTVAVLPGGLDAITPRHHADLAETIAGRGALVTEWASGGPVARGVFVMRNRLIAALAAVTVVVEASTTSGALHTAAFARRLGRPVLAVPGDVDRPTSRGCHALLRGGARVCEDAADVLAALPRGTGARARLLDALGSRPAGLEAIARRAGTTLPETLELLLRLEWAGSARALPGQRWARAGAHR